MEIRARTAALALAILTSSTALMAVPSAPTNLTAAVSGSTVALAWGAGTGAVITGYRLEAGTAPGLSNVASSVIGPVTGFTAASVPNGTYYVRVRAIALDGESDPSNEVIVSVGGSIGGGGSGGGGGGGGTPTCTSPPGAPNGLTRTISGLIVTFSWNAGTGCAATSYVLFAGSLPGASNIAIANVGGFTSFSAAAPAGTYYVRVVAQNAFGSSATSNEVSFSIAAAPTPTPTPNPTPAPTPPPTSRSRIGAVCRDSSLSTATGSGACSSHGGVSCWRYSDGSCTNP